MQPNAPYRIAMSKDIFDQIRKIDEGDDYPKYSFSQKIKMCLWVALRRSSHEIARGMPLEVETTVRLSSGEILDLKRTKPMGVTMAVWVRSLLAQSLKASTE